jgi:hypothetical protein
MTPKSVDRSPPAPDKDPCADDSTQPTTLVAGGPESEGTDAEGAPATTAADAPTPATHRKGVQPLSGTTD